MATDIGEIGKGFFDQNGNLKSKEVLTREAPEGSSPSNARPSEESASESEFSSQTVTRALSGERTRFTESANAEISRVNRAQETISDAEALVKEQISTNRALKKAIKSGDEEEAENLRNKLKNLDESRNKLAEESDRQNREDSLGTARELRVGNRAVGASTIPRISITPSSSGDTDTAAKVDDQIERLKGDLENLKTQRQGIKESRAALKESIKSGQQHIDAVEKSAIRTIGEAEKQTAQVADAIRSAGAQAVEVHTLNAIAVQTLT